VLFLGVEPVELRESRDLANESGFLVDGIIIPGGESTSIALVGGMCQNTTKTRNSKQNIDWLLDSCVVDGYLCIYSIK
jgi:glutamine amidotransferase PdxT